MDYKTISKNAIKIFTDFLHHINVDTEALKITEVLEVLFFLHYEGKTMTSELEAKLADYLYDDLLERYMTDKVFLMVACCLSMFDNPNTKFEEIKGANVKPESIKDIIVTFDVTFDESEPFLPIGKGGFTT